MPYSSALNITWDRHLSDWLRVRRSWFDHHGEGGRNCSLHRQSRPVLMSVISYPGEQNGRTTNLITHIHIILKSFPTPPRPKSFVSCCDASASTQMSRSNSDSCMKTVTFVQKLLASLAIWFYIPSGEFLLFSHEKYRWLHKQIVIGLWQDSYGTQNHVSCFK